MRPAAAHLAEVRREPLALLHREKLMIRGSGRQGGDLEGRRLGSSHRWAIAVRRCPDWARRSAPGATLSNYFSVRDGKTVSLVINFNQPVDC